jgi:hypothetical protein
MNKKKLFDACDDITLDVFHSLECGESIPLQKTDVRNLFIFELYRYDNGQRVVRSEAEDILEVSLHGESIRFTDIYGLS